MYLSSLRIKNFRCFDEKGIDVKFNQGLTVLVGENDSGKSAIIDAIRIVLGTTDLSWFRIDESDFYNGDIGKQIEICCKFSSLTLEEKAAFLECLTYEVNGKDESEQCLYIYWTGEYLTQFKPARFVSYIKTGVDGNGTAPSTEAKELLRVTYLKALRDAYSDMQSGRRSRLSQIIQNIPNLTIGKNEYESDMELKELSLIGIANLSNILLKNHDAIKFVNENLTNILCDKMVLKNDKMKTRFEVAGVNNSDVQKLLSLLEKLDLAIDELGKNSKGKFGLGTSNILSMACELLLNNESNKQGKSSFLLIEEPEAHIHAQRQLKIIQSLQKEAESTKQQVILTTHSPLIASVVKLENIIIIKKGAVFSLAKNCTKLEDEDYLYLEKYLDATKANLFFARSVIIVEGPGEALLFPTIAKLIGRSFTDYGTSLIDVHSTGLRRFSRILQRKNEDELLDIKVSCVTDRDIMPNCAPKYCVKENYNNIKDFPKKNERRWRTESDFDDIELKNYINKIIDKADGQSVKTFISDKWTLEYDLAYYGFKHDVMKNALLDALMKISYAEDNIKKWRETLELEINNLKTKEEKASFFYRYFAKKKVSKADFAQQLSVKLEDLFSGKEDELIKSLPPYIVDAIKYVTGE